MEFLKTIRAAFVTSSVLYVMVGLILIIMPATSLLLICRAIGTAVTLFGGVCIAQYLLKKGQRSIILGAVLFILGILIILKPGTIISVLPTILGVVLITNGVSNIQLSLEAKRDLKYWWLVGIAGIVNALLGIIAVLNPFSTAKIIMIFIGISLIIAGASDVFSLIFVRDVFKRIKSGTNNDTEEYNEID